MRRHLITLPFTTTHNFTNEKEKEKKERILVMREKERGEPANVVVLVASQQDN